MTGLTAEQPDPIETRHLVYHGPPARAALLAQTLRHADVTVDLIGPYEYQPDESDHPRVTVEIVAAGTADDMTRGVEHFLARAKGSAEVSIGPAVDQPYDYSCGNVRVTR
jgi:hypothetical protein